MKISALYESVTNSIVKEMEAGTVPWVKPWKTPRNHGSVMPHNLATGRPIDIHVIHYPVESDDRYRSKPSSEGFFFCAIEL